MTRNIKGMDKVTVRTSMMINFQHSCPLSAPSRNCVTRHQVLEEFPDTSHASFHKNNKINITIGIPVL